MPTAYPGYGAAERRTGLSVRQVTAAARRQIILLCAITGATGTSADVT
jgi:hypothetical protein